MKGIKGFTDREIFQIAKNIRNDRSIALSAERTKRLIRIAQERNDLPEKMELYKAIYILESHNNWRCDKNVPSIYEPTDPKKLTEAMNTAIATLKSMVPSSDVRLSLPTEDVCKCSCGWEGTEDELVVDYYDSYTDANAIAGSCPKCGCEVD